MSPSKPEARDIARWEIAAACAIFVAGLIPRLRLAVTTYLNPDEAAQALLSDGTWRLVFRNSLSVTHPPLLIMLTHLARLMSHSDLAVRLIPVLAGSVFPVLLSVWLCKIAGRVAGLSALVLLTFSPNPTAISAQLSSYTLAFLFLSCSLVVLEEALDRKSWRWMAAYGVLLQLCIVSDYSMAWFVGAAACYCMLRLPGCPRGVKGAWAAGQIAAAALYAFLFEVQVKAFSTRTHAISAGWLDGAFPRPGAMLSFPLANSAKPFAYLMASVPGGVVAFVCSCVRSFCCGWAGRLSSAAKRERWLR